MLLSPAQTRSSRLRAKKTAAAAAAGLDPPPRPPPPPTQQLPPWAPLVSWSAHSR